MPFLASQFPPPPGESPLDRHEHPRLLLTIANLPTIKARLGTGGVWATDFQTWVTWANAFYASALSQSLGNLVFLAADYAFLYATYPVTGVNYGIRTQADYGQLARSILLELPLQSAIVGNYHWYGMPLAWDWIYPLLSPGDKSTLLTMMETIDDYNILQPGVGSAFNSQATVARAQKMLTGLAVYGDGVDDAWATDTLALYPDYFSSTLGVTRSESDLDGEDGGMAQGMQYGFYTLPHTLLAEEGWRTAHALDATAFYSPTTKSYLRRFPLYYLTYLLPWAPVDGSALGRQYLFWKSEQTRAYVGATEPTVQAVLTGAVGLLGVAEPTMAALSQWLLDNRSGPLDAGDAFYIQYWGLWKFALGNTTSPSSPTALSLPLSRNGADGHAFFRTGWTALTDTLVTYTAGLWHNDPAGMSPNFPGGFTLDRHGPLLIRLGGISGHDFGAAGHANCNILQFVDSLQSVAGSYPNDDQGGGRMLPGGMLGSADFIQDSPFDLRGAERFLAHDDGVSRDADYISCDITRGYSSSLYSPDFNPVGGRVSQVVRSLVYFRPTTPGTDSDRLVIFDRATTTNTRYEKRWLLHFSAEPTVNGAETVGQPVRGGTGLGKWRYLGATQVVASNTSLGSNGRVYVTPVLPASRTIVKVGGNNSDGNPWTASPPSHEYEDGFGGLSAVAGLPPSASQEQYVGRFRIEIIPTTPALTDTFLNVIEAGSTSLASATPAVLLTTVNLVAVRVGSRVAVFNSVYANVVTGSLTVDTGGTYRFHFADLTPSGAYTLTVGGSPSAIAATTAGTYYAEIVTTTGMVIALS